MSFQLQARVTSNYERGRTAKDVEESIEAEPSQDVTDLVTDQTHVLNELSNGIVALNTLLKEEEENLIRVTLMEMAEVNAKNERDLILDKDLIGVGL